MDRHAEIERIAREHGLLAVYLFGSRADDGLKLLSGVDVERVGSDLDVGVVFRQGNVHIERLFPVEDALESLLPEMRLDVVGLQRVDALFQFDAIRGHRVAAPDPDVADSWELDVMRSAAELLPIQRANEIATFGFSTT
ncbi:MAG TPA: nucleotidyltransferase domain-containing protein [Thermoanaerobaculia bacterium]|jgi:predicted nucleotidyltransferase|nr:nucleotidyltransferase domain-containing protein [Thermoanaerobaculia bacterium]